MHSGQTPLLLHSTACRLPQTVLKPQIQNSRVTFFPSCLEKGCANVICQPVRLPIPCHVEDFRKLLQSASQDQRAISFPCARAGGGLLTDRKQDRGSFHSICSVMRGSLHSAPGEVSEWFGHGFNPAWRKECNAEFVDTKAEMLRGICTRRSFQALHEDI